MNWLRRLFAAEGGSILVIAALTLTSVVGMTGLAVEIGNGYAAKVRNQRVADMAALGAAVAYKSSQSSAAATQVAKDIVVANGLATGAITYNQSTTVGSAQAWEVSIQTSVPIRIARVVVQTASYNVTATAAASLVTVSTTGCVTALGNSATAISADGGASVSANGCSVVTNGTIYSSNSSAKVTAKQIAAAGINDTAAAYNQNGVTTNPTAHNWTLAANQATDFVKSNTSVQNVLCYVNKLTGSSDSDYPGGNTSCSTQLVTPTSYAQLTGTSDWTLSYQPKSAGGIYAYQDADNSCKYYPPAGTYNIGTLNVGSCTIVFAAGTTLNANTVTIGGGGSFTFGNGSLKIVNNFSLAGGVSVSIGNGSHSFGGISVGGGSSLMVGSGNLNISSELAVDGGGSNVAFALTTGNTVTIGNTSGASINVSGGAQLCFTPYASGTCSAPSAVAGTFSAGGTVSTSGGSLLVFPIASTHVINGDLTLQSGANFGSGLYLIKGNWTNGTGGSMTGTNVTFALGGSFNFAGGTSFDLAAPSTGSSYGVTDQLILTKTSSATSISAGSTGKASGMIYAPNSDFSSSGGSAISSNGSACMMLMVKTIAVTGSGTVNTANCSSQASSATTGTVALIL